MIDPDRFAPWVSADAAAMFRADSTAAPPPAGDIHTLRVHYNAFNQRHLDTARAHYAVDIVAAEIGGVRVSIITPIGGVTTDRTLLCLHGGAFMWGRGAGVRRSTPITGGRAGGTEPCGS